MKVPKAGTIKHLTNLEELTKDLSWPDFRRLTTYCRQVLYCDSRPSKKHERNLGNKEYCAFCGMRLPKGEDK